MAKPKIFVCSPYKGDTALNMLVAIKACRLIFEAGFVPFAPHLLYTQFVNESIESERNKGIACGLEFIPFCNAMVVIGEPTEGMNKEIIAANNSKVAILHFYDIGSFETFVNDNSNKLV